MQMMQESAVTSATNEESKQQPYEFVGGPYDGRRLPVVPPPEAGVELMVHTVGQPIPAEFYVLGDDGRFHYNAPPPLSHGPFAVA